MIKKNRININSLVLIVLFLSMIFISCDKNEINDPTGTPPEVPPVSTMKIDFNLFPSNSLPKVSPDLNIDNIQSGDNWRFASLSGIFWQSLITVGMAVPVASFVESFNHDPVQQDDGTWLWTYEFTTPLGTKYTASLFADVGILNVNWEMYISRSDDFDNFLWYTGESNLITTSGTWTLFREPNDPTPWIEIEWKINTEDSTADIKYTNIVPEGPENGGFIFYGVTTDSEYDAFYEIYNKGKENLTVINWNLETHEGRVKDNEHFGDNEWHCWDSNLENIECP